MLLMLQAGASKLLFLLIILFINSWHTAVFCLQFSYVLASPLRILGCPWPQCYRVHSSPWFTVDLCEYNCMDIKYWM